MKILFDTNVLVSGFIGRGTCHEVILDATANHQVYYTDFVISEFQSVFRRKFKFPESLIHEFTTLIKIYFNKAETAPGVLNVCRDDSDNQILADALSNGIELIISGDPDLLELKNYKGIKIIFPRAYWNL